MNTTIVKNKKGEIVATIETSDKAAPQEVVIEDEGKTVVIDEGVLPKQK